MNEIIDRLAAAFFAMAGYCIPFSSASDVAKKVFRAMALKFIPMFDEQALARAIASMNWGRYVTDGDGPYNQTQNRPIYVAQARGIISWYDKYVMQPADDGNDLKDYEISG